MEDINCLKIVLNTGKWFAKRLGKSFCIVNFYVYNRRQLNLEQLFEIAKILNVEPKDLIAKK